MEEKANAQEERIISLEEELATLRWKKACTCGEKGKRTVVAAGSGEPSELEYADEDEEAESSPDSSYHSPTVAQDEQLLVFGSPAVEEAPILLPSSCACLVPAVIHIKDDVEMTIVPRENERPIPVQVERPPRYTVGVQHSSCGQPVAHYKSSTHHLNCHAKQLGIRCPSSLETFMGQDAQFPSVKEFHAHVLASRGGADLGSSQASERLSGSSEDIAISANH